MRARLFLFVGMIGLAAALATIAGIHTAVADVGGACIYNAQTTPLSGYPTLPGCDSSRNVQVKVNAIATTVPVNCTAGCSGGGGASPFPSSNPGYVTPISGANGTVALIGGSNNTPSANTNVLWTGAVLESFRAGIGMVEDSTCEPNSSAPCESSARTQVNYANNVATAGQSWSGQVIGGSGGVRNLEVCMSTSAATTITVQMSPDNGNTYYDDTLPGTQTSADWTATGAKSICEQVSPGPYMRFVTSAAATIIIQTFATI
jgi:hypothetical protein